MGSISNVNGSGTLADGDAVELVLTGYQLPATVWVEPANGDTVTVTYKTSKDATAQPWPNGDATAYSEDSLVSPIYSVLFQRIDGAGTTSKYGVQQ
jgi:hypothetical protein